MKDNNKEPKFSLRLPAVSLGAEYLTIGYLMRRNIMAYKAPPNNEGYDLICIHPDPKEKSKIIKVQVKSRYQTDSNGDFPVKDKTFDAFDYLIVVFLNVGYFYKARPKENSSGPEFYTIPKDIIVKHHKIVASGWQKVETRKIEGLDDYKNEKGFELIARDLGVLELNRENYQPKKTTKDK